MSTGILFKTKVTASRFMHQNCSSLLVNVWMGIDRSDQALTYYSTECRTRRKQNRVLDSIVEMHALNNTHAVWINSPNLSGGDNHQALSIAEYSFDVIRVWYAIFRRMDGKPSVLHYSLQCPKKRRQLENVLASPRKSSHIQIKLTNVDTPSKGGQLK